MKKILYLILGIAALVSFSSCSEKLEPEKLTQYRLSLNISSITPTSAVKWDVTVYEYNEAGEKVANNSISKAVFGSNQTFTANSRAVKVKVYIKMYGENTTVAPQYLWVQQVYYLEEGECIELSIDDHTKVGNKEP